MMIIQLLFWMQLYSLGQYRLQPLTQPAYQPITPLQLPPIQLFTPVAANNGASGNCSVNCAVILPLAALELQGTRLNDGQVALQWKTKHETASRGFEVERSLGDAVHFAAVGSVPSHTGAAVEKRYTHMDANSYTGTSFYRIRQVDLNGNFAYSNTIAVKGYDKQGTLWVTPNPAGSVARLTCYTANGGTATVRILTAQGQVVQQVAWTLAVGSNSLALPVSTFPPGTYTVQIIWATGHRSTVQLTKA